MKNPQTTAQELYEVFKIPMFKPIADSACCVLTLMWCLHMEKLTDFEAIEKTHEMIKAKAIKSDCTVKWYDAVEYLTGRPLRGVEFKDISSLKGIKERTPVLFRAPTDDPDKPSEHWVGVENGRIRFNALVYSKTVATGKPAEARILKL